MAGVLDGSGVQSAMIDGIKNAEQDLVIISKIPEMITREAAWCTRCGKALPKFDLKKPYCDTCFPSWSRDRNEKYSETFCHGCGSDGTKNVLAFEKSMCKSCYTEYYEKENYSFLI